MTNSQLNRFATNPVNIDIPRSRFKRDHSVKFSFNVGDVVPFYVDEILPGDTVSIDTAKVVRMQPLVCPVMDNLFLDTYYFFIPNRLVWDHWKEFMGENTQSAWTPSVEYTIPTIKWSSTSGLRADNSIADYMGIPKGCQIPVSVLPFRAYALVMSEWFRDQNLQDPVHVFKDDVSRVGSVGSNQVTDIELGGMPFIANKFFDYFTGCLPQPQRGPAVRMPLGDLAPVFSHPSEKMHIGDYTSRMSGPLRFGKLDSSFQFAGAPDSNHNLTFGAQASYATGANPLDSTLVQPSSAESSAATQLIAPANLFADMQSVTSFSINELRQAFAVQRYYERLARGGARYTEMIKSFFGVTSPDSRLQRPEYLGGNRIPLNISSVAQTSATEQNLTPLGNLAAISQTGDSHSDFTHSFTEHGILLGVCVARYHHTYQQGINRMWIRRTNFDFYNPVFANLGEQAVKTCEIFVPVGNTDEVFGYQEAWAEYRYAQNRVAGELRSTAATPLDMWHFADHYVGANPRPYLSDSWIREDKSNVDRALAVQSSVSQQLIADFYIDGTWVRPMPLYSIPGLIDHH